MARIDGVVVREEIDLIKKIGKSNGLSSEEINECFDNPSDQLIITQLSDDQKFDYLFNIIQLMKIDGRLYEEEIIYCAKIVSNLGYDEKVLGEMMLKVYSDPYICSDKKTLKGAMKKYLL